MVSGKIEVSSDGTIQISRNFWKFVIEGFLRIAASVFGEVLSRRDHIARIARTQSRWHVLRIEWEWPALLRLLIEIIQYPQRGSRQAYNRNDVSMVEPKPY